MRQDRDYSDTPGTYVFDSEHSRQGYHLNMFCMSLNKEANRERFRRDERAYLDAFPMSSQQRTAVLQRDWTGMLRLGGNIYYTFKLAIVDGINMQEIGARMEGVPVEQFKTMMVNGGRPIHGNRYQREWNRDG